MINQKNSIVKVAEVELPVDRPLGHWVLDIDVHSGEVYGSKNKMGVFHKDMTGSHRGQAIAQREQALAALLAREDKTEPAVSLFSTSPKVSATATGNGNGNIYDPDPMTTLQDSNMNADSANLDNALQNRSLPEISKTDGYYKLSGPWISIANFETGLNGSNVDPSQTVDGVWNYDRDTTEFREANVYHHLDKSQRYIQTLGFVGNKGIQHGTMEVDIDGINGAINAYYLINSNRISFGRSLCGNSVHLAEAAGVPLHEYGHAIHL